MDLSKDPTADDRKDEAYRIVEHIEKALPEFDKPVMLLTFTPGALIQERDIAWAKTSLKRLTHRHLGEGSHFVQEDQPEAIGQAIVEWLR
ncbi:MAG: hypothetical protein ACE5JD_06690 [Candidatus Methylomirabilia bacterium]